MGTARARVPGGDYVTQYEKMAEAYARDAATHPLNALYDRPAMMALLGDLHEHRVLEVGCAAGALTKLLVEAGASVIATDVSPQMVRLAQASLGSSADVMTMDVTDRLPFTDGLFDVVVSSLTMHYIEHWGPVLRELRRTLKQGGVFAFSTHHPAHDWEHTPDDYFAKQLVSETWTKSGIPFDVSFWRRPLTDMTAAIADAGFLIERIVEPAPSEELRDADPRWHGMLATRPRFLYFRLIRA